MAIFRKSDDNDNENVLLQPSSAQTRPPRSKHVTIIGSTLVFKGELSADEDLIIEGHIEGTIAHHKKHLTVGEHGRVKADIHASSVIVLGKLVGDIHSEGMVSLAKGADVCGNIFCGQISMESGARFKGRIDMGEPIKVTAVEQPPVRAESPNADKPPKLAGHTAKASVY